MSVFKISTRFCLVSTAAVLLGGVSGAHAFDNVSRPQMSAPLGHYSLVSVDESVQKGAETFVDSMVQRAVGFLGASDISAEKQRTEFQSLLNDNFDIKTIARFSLGRYWRQASDAQKKEYLGLFKAMIVNVYSRRFSDYQGQKIEVQGSRADGKSDVLVSSNIVAGDGPKIRVDWRVRNKNGKYRVIDVIVEGVSMSLTQRSDFASVIQRGGGKVEVLLEHLRG